MNRPQAIGDAALRRAAGRQDSEADLVRLAKARSPEAWTQIFHSHYPKLFRYAYARVGDADTAEDIAGTVFLEAFKSVDSYSYRGRPLLAWLYRIARNLVADHHQASQRSRLARLKDVPGRAAASLSGGQAPMATPDGRPQAPDAQPLLERLDLQQAMGQLTPEQREVIALRYFAGFALPEVAKLMAKNERAVYSLQARAIAALKRHLQR